MRRIGAGGQTVGHWQFTLDSGTTWQELGAPSESVARLLRADGQTRVRFVPNDNVNGQVQLYYRAWDRTLGATGDTLSTAGNQGGTKVFSSAVESATLTITPMNDKPFLGLSGTVGYVHDAAAVVLAPNAVVADVDSPDFDTGQLTVRITTGASAANQLVLGAGFSVDGSNNVLQGSTIIGALNAGGGQGTTDLIVTFNAAATKAIVQALVRAVSFKTSGGSAGARTLVFSLTDGDGGISDEQTKTVNVT